MPSGRSADLRALEALALRQGGYFDRADALTHGLGDDLLGYHTGRGRFERIYPGVYRLAIAPIDHWDSLLLAWVWTNRRGAVSHESALLLHDLSDVMPGRIHLTVPPTFGRSSAPYVLHRSQLAEDDLTWRDGVPVTTPARSIVDAASAGTDPEQVQRAVRQALDRALASPEGLRAAAARARYRHRRTVCPLIERAISHAA